MLKRIHTQQQKNPFTMHDMQKNWSYGSCSKKFAKNFSNSTNFTKRKKIKS